MAYPILGTPAPQFLDSSGDPYASGTITTLDPADDSVKASYPTADDADAGTTGTSGDITLDAEGKPTGTQYWGKDGEDYKVVIKDSAGSTVDSMDDIKMPLRSRRAAVTFDNADATPTVGEGNLFITQGTTAITNFNDGQVGDTIQILAASSITITHGSAVSLLGSVNFDMVAGDSLTLTMFNDQVWEEVGRASADAKYESVTSFTNTLTAAENNTTYFLNLVGGGSTVLPSPALGLKFTFIVATAPTTAYTIDTASGANVMHGVNLDIVGELVYATARDIISFVASTSLVGDRVEVTSDGTSWFYTAFSGANGGITTGQT